MSLTVALNASALTEIKMLVVERNYFSVIKQKL